MTCNRCGHELRDDRQLGVISAKTGRPTCPQGGPHRLPQLPITDEEIWRALGS